MLQSSQILRGNVMIIYIHGFGSSGLGGKSTQFREYFKERNIPFIAPSLSYVPELAIATLEELISTYDDVSLIGSSLGGFYSMYLAEKFGLKAVLINPAMNSAKTLKRLITEDGMAYNYYDESHFEWKLSHIEMLKQYHVSTVIDANYFLLLQKGDDVLDFKEAVDKLPKAKLVLEEGGTHPFEGIERYFVEIEGFIVS